jgi:hypothetical protein
MLDLAFICNHPDIVKEAAGSNITSLTSTTCWKSIDRCLSYSAG